jgi:hypothetical protein
MYLKRCFLVGLLTFISVSSSAQLYFPTDVPSLINAINSSNSNTQNDIIDLGGNTFTLHAAAEQNEWGPMGLPIIKEAVFLLTIRNGIIKRDINAPPFRFLYINAQASLALQDVTLSNGLAKTNDSDGSEGAGGAIVNHGTISSIHNCVFDNNVATGDTDAISVSKWAYGGAIYNTKVIQNITSTRFENNQAIGIDLIPWASTGSPLANGGAIFSGGTGNTINRIADTVFINNVAIGGNAGVGTFQAFGQGGALFLSFSKVNTIENTLFESNIASGGAGVSGPASDSLPAYAVKASPGEGGAIFASRNTSITSIQNSVFNYNLVRGGDGDRNLDAPAAFARGGAIHLEAKSTISALRNTLFNANSAQGGNGAQSFLSAAALGGAISLSGSSIGNISFNTFTDNVAMGGNSNAVDNFDGVALGGALYLEDSNKLTASISSISNTTFSNNSVWAGDFDDVNDGRAQGGGIYLKNTSFSSTIIGSISNTTFSLNLAENFGGALSLSAKAIISSIYSVTITANQALEGFGGGGIFLEDTATIGKFASNIVAKNIDGGTNASQDIQIDDLATIANPSYNLIGVNTGHAIINGANFNKVGTEISPLNPLLGPLQNNGGVTETHALLPRSPAINSGTSSSAIYDQRGPGFSRTLNGRTDIGAFESSLSASL